MSLLLRNAQRVVPLRRAPLRRRLQLLRAALGLRRFDLAVVCLDDAAMRRLNGRYGRSDAATDVLAFPFHENLRAGELPRAGSRDERNLGDILLGVECVSRWRRDGEDLYDALTVTAAHGLCHLLGFTHNTEAEWQKMFQKEKQVLEELSRHLGTELHPLTDDLFSKKP